MAKYNLIVKNLRQIDKYWDDQFELFADNGSLVLIDRVSGEVLEEFTNILCDGGDPDYHMHNGTLYITRE